MANKKIQQRNKKRKQEQMKTASQAVEKEPTRKPIPWFKVVGVILIAALLIGAFAVKFFHDQSLVAASSEQSSETATSSSSA